MKKVGRHKGYDANTFPLLVEGYARSGLFDKQIANNLGVSKAAFYRYLIEFPEMKDALKRGRAPVNIEVENAVLKRALGYEFDERTTETEITNNEAVPISIKTTKKHIPGDVGAMAFWLKNKMPEQWKDRHNVTLEEPVKIIVTKKKAQ